MSRSLHRMLVGLALGVCTTVAAEQVACAQDEGAEGEGGGSESDEETGADADKDEDKPEGGSWGVGGDEEEGKFKPAGKTGKLKDLEEEDEEEREEEDKSIPLPPPGFAYLDWALGVGDIRALTNTGGSRAVPAAITDVTPTASFLIGLGYRIGDTWLVTARFAVSTGESDGPIEPLDENLRDRDNYTQIAVGGLELGVMPHFRLSNRVRIPVGLALTMPTQAGDYLEKPEERQDALLARAILNQAAASSRGFEDRALFEPKRFGLIPSGGVIYQMPMLSGGQFAGMLTAEARTKVEMMFSAGNNDPPMLQEDAPGGELAEVHAAAVNWVTTLSGFYDAFDGLLGVGLKAWLAAYSATTSLGDQQLSGATFVLEPNVRTHIGFTEDKAFGMDARVGYTIPLGGDIGAGNDVSVGGLRVTAGFYF